MTSTSKPLAGIEFRVSPRLFSAFSVSAARLGIDPSTAVEYALAEAAAGMRAEHQRRREHAKQVAERCRALQPASSSV
jgi:hypothetical protein